MTADSVGGENFLQRKKKKWWVAAEDGCGTVASAKRPIPKKRSPRLKQSKSLKSRFSGKHKLFSRNQAGPQPL